MENKDMIAILLLVLGFGLIVFAVLQNPKLDLPGQDSTRFDVTCELQVENVPGFEPYIRNEIECYSKKSFFQFSIFDFAYDEGHVSMTISDKTTTKDVKIWENILGLSLIGDDLLVEDVKLTVKNIPRRREVIDFTLRNEDGLIVDSKSITYNVGG